MLNQEQLRRKITNMGEISVEPGWARILRLGLESSRDVDTLAIELAWMEWGEGGEEDPGAEDAMALVKVTQDCLKYKQEQVTVLLEEVDKLKLESGSRRRKKVQSEVSPTRSNDSYLEMVAHQEEEIRANKEILEQLYADIAELEDRKKGSSQQNKLELDRDSNSSREPLSERDQVRQLEDQVAAKNKHIRKMLADIKILEEENRQLKEKISIVREELSEATQFIQNLTEQVRRLKNDCSALSETIGKTEEVKAQLQLDMDDLRKKLNERNSNKMEVSEEIQAKLLYWKNHAKARKSENEILQNEISRLKKENAAEKDNSYLSNMIQQQEEQIKQLQEKLSEASDEILDSVKLIEALKAETKKLKLTTDRVDLNNTSFVSKAEYEATDDEVVMSKMKKKIHSLTSSLKISEETLALREQELAEVTSHLKIIESGESGVQSLLDGLKNKKRQLKLKNVGIKTLIHEINDLTRVVDGLQTENEAMREKLNLGQDEIIPTMGVLAKFHKSEKRAAIAEKRIREMEDAMLNLELSARKYEKLLAKLKNGLKDAGFSNERMEALLASSESESEVMPDDGGGESSMIVKRRRKSKTSVDIKLEETPQVTEEMKALIEENDGLRRGMQEILEFLKDNRTTTSGTLAVQCPSLEKIVHSLDARHAAGWYAPHMAAVMGLQAAIGGRDALLTALNEARKETFEVMEKLSKEYEKSSHLEQKLQVIENKTATEISQSEQKGDEVNIINNGIFGTWMSNADLNKVNVMDKDDVKCIIENGNKIHETHLKEALKYFHKQFKTLFQKMTEISIQTTNDHNKWDIEEEKYKAEIMSLKAQLDVSNIEDCSENSEGVVAYPNAAVVARKCTYLEESYKYIRTLNANMKNECMDYERQKIILSAEFESQIQVLVLHVANLTDRLRNSVSMELFLKQNDMLNDVNVKYRKLLDMKLENVNSGKSLEEGLEKQRLEIIDTLMNSKISEKVSEEDKILQGTELSVVRKQLSNMCKEFEEEKKIIKMLENVNFALQETQKQLIDSALSSATKEEHEIIQSQLEKFMEDNKSLKNQCSHITNQLEISISQFQDIQQRQISNDLEINMLRHQVLDLQATGDNKAIIARLSGEILIAHLQTADTSRKIDKLNAALAKQKQRRLEAEEMMRAREKIFNVYAARYEFRFRYMSEVLQMLRQQYQGSLPIACIENYLNDAEELSRKNIAVDNKLSEIEDKRAFFATKSQVYEEIIEKGALECPIDDKKCPHEIKLTINQNIHARDMDHCTRKIELLEKSRQEIMNRCNALERTLVLVNQEFDKAPLSNKTDKKMWDTYIYSAEGNAGALQLEDVISDEDEESRRSQTITLPKPQILKSRKPSVDIPKETKQLHDDEKSSDLPGSPIKITPGKKKKKNTVVVQTEPIIISTKTKIVQTESDGVLTKLKKEIKLLKEEKERKQVELTAALALASQRAESIMSLESSKVALDAHLKSIQETVPKNEALVETLYGDIEDLKKIIANLKHEEHLENKRKKDSVNEETKALLQTVKKLENDKNNMIEEYKEMLKNEREEFASSIKECHQQIRELQEKLDKRDLHPVLENNEISSLVAKYEEKLSDLENQCFKLQNTLDGCRGDLKSSQNELERWKVLAAERLDKIENLSKQFEEKYTHEMDSYRKESQHWLAQLTDSQKESQDLRNKLTEHRALYMKQLTQKEGLIEQQKSATQNLKSQMLGLQSMISASDPSFNLSGIVEVEETSDVSPQGTDRLEIKFHSSNDLIEQAGTDDYGGKEPAVTSPTWHETVVDRLRREKQVLGKQNMLLRRQIKALAGRERRSRLEAQNLKTQMYRLSSGSKLSADASSVSLNNKVAALASQLSSARRDTNAANMNIWEKWKRAQQLAEKWQARFEDKCEELKKCESTLNYTKSAVARLDKEKKILLAKVGEMKSEKHISFSKDIDQRNSPPTKEVNLEQTKSERSSLPPHITVQSLIDRIEAQQRRIAALELANKGQEPLVTEYEKVLAQTTLLKGQVLRLESQVLEMQLTSGRVGNDDSQLGELEHLRSYCEALKEENMQLSAKVSLSTVEGGAYSSTAHRINDLEQTVLTLRGLVNKLTRKSPKRGELSRSGSAYSIPEQDKSGLETMRAEISNLRRVIADKDQLLERSRDLLKMAAEREEQLLQEVTYLRDCLSEVKTSK